MANIIQTFPNGAGGGHEVLGNGVAVPQEKKLDFNGLSVTDDSTNEKTVVEGVGLNQDSLDDIAGSGLPGTILAGSGLNYSLTEQIVGRWIDGKPLYQITLSGAAFKQIPSSRTYTNFYTTEMANLNIDYVQIITGRMRTRVHDTGASAPTRSLWYNDYANAQYTFSTEAGTNAIQVWGWITNRFYDIAPDVTIQYTKTTD